MAMQSKVRSAVVLALAGVVTLPAWAADPPPDATGALEEITVTARKRTESLQETPISISAFSADRLESQGITSIMRIQDITPNLVFQNTPSNSGLASNAAVYIRGIGQKDFAPTTDPGVGLYVDGVYLGRTAGAVFDLVDIEQVEVLRGPQGTLFGRNTIGGAINITTKKPDGEFRAKADVKFGTDSRINVRASVNVPFTDTFYGKLTAASFKQEGYVTRTVDGRDLGNQDYKTGRIALRWLPTDTLDIDFAADYAKDKSNGPPVVITRVDRPSDTPGSFVTLNNAFAFFDPATGPGDPNQCFTAANLNNPLCYNDRVVGGKDTNLGSGPNFSDLSTKSASLSAEWRLPLFTMKSVTAWRKVDGEFAQDRDGGAQPLGGLFQAPINHVFDTFEQKQVSQEFQVLGKAFDDRVNWVAGLYWFKEEGENLNPVDFRPVAIQSGGFFDYKSTAAFAQFTWAITDSLKVTPGVRYTKDDRDYLPDQFFESLPLGPLGFPCFVPSFHIPCVVGDRVVPFEKVSADASKTNPYLNVAYQWSPGFMTYATYAEGFRSGGYTQRIFPPEASLPSFKPENVKSYELGFKYTTPGESMRLNGAVFYTDYEDLQLLVSDASRIGPFVTNAGKAAIQGFELEWALSPGAGWRVDASIGYTDPEYKEIDARVNPADLNTDSDFVFVSDWNTSVSVEKLFTLGASGTLRPRVDWSWRSKFATNANGVPQPSTLPRDFLYQPAYSVVNASVNWASDDERYSVALGVDNLGDEQYRIFGDYQPGFGFTMEAFDRGRQWYVKAGVSF